MVKVFDNLLCTINDRKYILLVLLDLIPAFDTIDHDVLMLLLQKLIGLKGEAAMVPLILQQSLTAQSN